MTPNKRPMRWVERLMTKKSALERSVGMPIGRLLGCGHWGCVFESTEPWVVKFSIDPTEGPAWQMIVSLIEKEAYGTTGVARVKSLHRVLPDLAVGGRPRKVWAIVREAVEPVFHEYSPKELGERGRGTILATSPFTNAHLGYGGPESIAALRQGTPRQMDFARGIDALLDYRMLATLWHLFGLRHPGTVQKLRLETLQISYDVGSRDDVEEKIERVLRHFGGPDMGPLGETLSMLSGSGVYLQDVHAMNIGWHVKENDADYDHVVVFDPGHTPTEGTGDIPELFVENRARL